MLLRNVKRDSGFSEMSYMDSAADRRSASEIMAEARTLQTRHAPRALAAAGRWLRGALMFSVGKPGTIEARRAVVH